MSKPEEQSFSLQRLTQEQVQNIVLMILQHQKILQSLDQQGCLVLVIKPHQKVTLTSQMKLMSDSMVELTQATGIPFTRKNYLEIMGLTEPLDPEMEAQIPKCLK